MGKIDNTANAVYNQQALNIGSFGSGLESAYNLAHNMLLEERAYNSAEAEKNRQWQEEMSNTAYSRAVSDMRNAGLNPYLAYSQGGATTGSGATAQHNGISGSLFSSFTSALNSVLSNQTSMLNSVLNSITARQNSKMSNITKFGTTAMNNATDIAQSVIESK